MFTDTKNLANLTVNTTNAVAKQINTHTPDEEKFKLKKMWKPIIRLMSRKSALARNSKRDNNSGIPNNVNLNNATQYACINKDTLTSLEENNSYVTDKLPLAEFWQTQQQLYQTSQQESSTQALEFISKASIDKTPLDTCTYCIYGRNCQHTETLHSNVSRQPHAQTHTHTQQQPHAHPHNLQSLNYFDAEEGCFVWSDIGGDIDENALREWLWQNSLQIAENATMC